MYCFYVVTCDDDEDAQCEFSKMRIVFNSQLETPTGKCGHLWSSFKTILFFLANTNREQAEPPLQLQIHVLTFKA